MFKKSKLVKTALVIATINMLAGLLIPLNSKVAHTDQCPNLLPDGCSTTPTREIGKDYRPFLYQQREEYYAGSGTAFVFLNTANTSNKDQRNIFHLDNILLNFSIVYAVVFGAGHLVQKIANRKKQ